MKKNKPFLGIIKFKTHKGELKNNLEIGIINSLLEKYKRYNVLVRLDDNKYKVENKISA
tara:strand:+ start:469 stop:645 length:177 start_codon:yes stop_codon:yes gene_type:complete